MLVQSIRGLISPAYSSPTLAILEDDADIVSSVCTPSKCPLSLAQREVLVTECVDFTNASQLRHSGLHRFNERQFDEHGVFYLNVFADF
jgi:hypothetical protein